MTLDPEKRKGALQDTSIPFGSAAGPNSLDCHPPLPRTTAALNEHIDRHNDETARHDAPCIDNPMTFNRTNPAEDPAMTQHPDPDDPTRTSSAIIIPNAFLDYEAFKTIIRLLELAPHGVPSYYVLTDDGQIPFGADTMGQALAYAMPDPDDPTRRTSGIILPKRFLTLPTLNTITSLVTSDPDWLPDYWVLTDDGQLPYATDTMADALEYASQLENKGP